MATLTKAEILDALRRLGELAEQQGDLVELLLVGGAAMVLLYDARVATRDVDVLIRSPKEARRVRALALQVATDYDLPKDWLNDGAKGYIVGISEGHDVFSAPGIVVSTPSVAQLLAMKLSAWRDDVDINDAAQLLQALTGEQEHVWSMVEPYLVPGNELKARYAFLDLWEAIYDRN
ncbi:MAG: hypothetical protein KDJ52_25060 [Anaerolineae bacterium]|nr:hypothetical protein [Anaerolineae bacterium]